MLWCAATCRQRFNANGFNAIWFILLKQMQHYFNHRNITQNHTTKGIFLKCSLCAHWFFFITPDSSFLLLFSSCCLLPCWELTAYLPYSQGPGPLLPPFPKLTPFPSGPGQRPAPMAGTMTGQDSFSCPPLQKQEAQYVHTLYKWEKNVLYK